MIKPKRLDGRNKIIKFTHRLESDLRSYCRDKNIESESELIRQAIGKYIYADYQDETLKLQGIKQLQDKVDRQLDLLEIIFNYMIKMHINILAYHPELDGSVKTPAFASATARHEKFMTAFKEGLKNDPPSFERLLHTFFSEDNSNG